jgi:hypothetical protein
MNQFFGGRLRKELVELMDHKVLMRIRAQSSGSQRLSSDSTRLDNDNDLSLSQATFEEAGF